MNAPTETPTLQTVLITGASSGIGLEMAREFARHGHNLLLVARNQDQLAQVASMIQTEHGVAVQHIAADLTQASERERLYAEATAQGPIDIVVNNAGEGAFGKFHEIPYERLHYIIELNVVAVTHLTHLFLPDMLQRGQGHILNTASIASFEPGPLLQVYHATKSFVLLLTEALAWEYEDSGVRFTALAPGATDTDFFVKADMEESPMAQKEDLADAEDVAKHAYARMMAGDVVTVHKLKNKMYASLYRFLPRQSVTAMMGNMYRPKGDEDRDGQSERHGFVDRNAGTKISDRESSQSDAYGARGRYTEGPHDESGSKRHQDIRDESELGSGATFETQIPGSYQGSDASHNPTPGRLPNGSTASSPAAPTPDRDVHQDARTEDAQGNRGYESIRSMSYGTESAEGYMDQHGDAERFAPEDSQRNADAHVEGDRLNQAFGPSRGSGGTATSYGSASTANGPLPEDTGARDRQALDRVFRDDEDQRKPMDDEQDSRHRTGTDRPGQGI